MSTSIRVDSRSEYDQWHQELAVSRGVDRIHLSDWHRDALKLLGDIRGKRVLEVGCGNGDFAFHLASLGCTLTAVDFSPAAINVAQERKRRHFPDTVNIEFACTNAENLDFSDSSFDLLVSCECLEHLPTPKNAIREFFRVLKPGGRLVLTTENYSNGMIIPWLMCGLLNRPFNSGAGVQPIEQFFLFWRVKRMMMRAGFFVDTMLGHHHVFFILPKMHPHTFVVEKFSNAFLQRLLLPLARHIAFHARKP